MEKKIIGREYLSSTKCDLQEDGTWKAYNAIVDKVLYEGDAEWTEEKIDAISFNDDAQLAIQTAMTSSLNFLLENVYQNGFKGLVEYRAYERSLKEDKRLDA
jgi:hypothetical protein